MLAAILLSLTSCGVHFTRSFLTVFSVYLIDEGLMSPAGYGAILTIMSFSSIIVPLYFGCMATDAELSFAIMMRLLIIVLLGQLLFIISIRMESFVLEMIAWCIFGLCSSSISSMQRAITSQYMINMQGIATGIYVSLANISKVAGKLSVTPIMNIMVTSANAAIIPFLSSLVPISSLLVAKQYLSLSTYQSIPYSIIPNIDISTEVLLNYEERDEDARDDSNPKSGMIIATRNSLLQEIQQGSYQLLSIEFYVLALVHACFVAQFHVLISFIPHYGKVHWRWGIKESSYVAALPSIMAIFMAPLIGCLADQIGDYLPLCLISGIIATFSFWALYASFASAVPSILVFTIANISLSTLCLAAISKIVARDRLPLAFAFIEVFDALSSFASNGVFTSLYSITESYTMSMLFLLGISLSGTLLLVFLLFHKSQGGPTFDSVHYLSFLY